MLSPAPPEILGPLESAQGGVVLAKLLRHLHGDPQDLGLWEVVQGEAWVLSHPEHGQWKSAPQDMLQHLRAVEVRAAQRSPTTTARVLHIDRQIQYTVERTAAGLVLEVMVSHGHAWYPVTVALSAAERQDWIVQGPSSTRELAEAFLADEKGFLQSREER